MKRITKIVLLFIVLFTSLSASAADYVDSAVESMPYNWDSVINAIIQVESGGDRKAKSGNSVGVMQITPTCVAECNRILRKRKSKKRFKLSDRFSIAKSKEMFILIQSAYNPMNSIEKAIRSWNGGQHYSIKRTQRYFNKVMCYMKN